MTVPRLQILSNGGQNKYGRNYEQTGLHIERSATNEDHDVDEWEENKKDKAAVCVRRSSSGDLRWRRSSRLLSM